MPQHALHIDGHHCDDALILYIGVHLDRHFFPVEHNQHLRDEYFDLALACTHLQAASAALIENEFPRQIEHTAFQLNDTSSLWHELG